MQERDEFVFGVDLDGVCADFYGGLRPIAADWLEVSEDALTRDVSYGLKEWGVPDAPGGYADMHRYAVTQRDLFLHLAPIQGCATALRRLSKAGIRIRVITHRLFIKYFHQAAVAQTVKWLDRHDIPYWDLCFMRDKDAVGADLYIDDAPDNIRALRASGFEAIVFVNSTNRHCAPPRAETWQEVHDLVMRRYASWSARRGQ